MTAAVGSKPVSFGWFLQRGVGWPILAGASCRAGPSQGFAGSQGCHCRCVALESVRAEHCSFSVFRVLALFAVLASVGTGGALHYRDSSQVSNVCIGSLADASRRGDHRRELVVVSKGESLLVRFPSERSEAPPTLEVAGAYSAVSARSLGLGAVGPFEVRLGVFSLPIGSSVSSLPFPFLSLPFPAAVSLRPSVSVGSVVSLSTLLGVDFGPSANASPAVSLPLALSVSFIERASAARSASVRFWGPCLRGGGLGRSW